jgi:hypothetical protein
MLFLDEVIPNKLLKKKCLLPINENDKKHGAMIYLLTPNFKSSINLMKNPMFINRAKSYQAYYLDKDVTYYINSKNYLQESAPVDNRYNILYPDSESVELEESVEDLLYNSDIINNVESVNEDIDYRPTFISKDCEMTDEYLRGRNAITIFRDAYLTEDGKNDTQLRKLLYNERLKTNKNVFDIYKEVKAECPFIMKTFSNLKLYKGLNLFADLSYYTEAFFKNNFWKADKAVQLYYDFMIRLLNDGRYDQYGYTHKTIFIPILDWNIKNGNMWDYKKTINPVSVIIRMAYRYPEHVQETLKGFNIIFVGENNYFKMDFKDFDKTKSIKFINLIKRVIAKDANTDDLGDPDTDSPKVIIATITDSLENNERPIKYKGLTGKSGTIKPKEISVLSMSPDNKKQTSVKKARPEKTTNINKNETKAKKEISDELKEELLDNIKAVANSSNSVEDAVDKLSNNEYISKIMDTVSEDEENTIKINAARSKRLSEVGKSFDNIKVHNKTVKDYLEEDKPKEIKETSVPVDSINEEWKHLSYAKFNETYDINEDIVKIINSFKDKTIPVVVRSMDVQNTSTSEDLIETWTLDCEDALGQRFKLKFDVPLFVDNQFMRLRGNLKSIQGQLLLLPIIKTDPDVCQIVSNYNKIFLQIQNNSVGKSNVAANKVIKLLTKNRYKDIDATEGNTEKISIKYDLPMDYVDIGRAFSKIETKDFIIYLNQDEIRKNYKYDLKYGIPVVYTKENSKLLYFGQESGDRFSTYLVNLLCQSSEEFQRDYDDTSAPSNCAYSVCSILDSKIPTIVVMAHAEGLVSALNKANINYRLFEKKNPDFETSMYDKIKFKDGLLYYESTASADLLMNGLRICDTNEMSIADLNKKSTWVEQLDNFGGRIKADGLDNFYDLMMDPITVSVCKDFDLPSDYVTALAYANGLLTDNKYNKHVDISGNRFRKNEIVAGYVYKALAQSYGAYRNQLKRTKKAPMTMKQSAVIDLVMLDPTMADASILTPLLEIETSNAVTFKGLSGMNSERSYGLDKRTFDDSMTNVLAMSTGFAGNVGITRQATIDMGVGNSRGYLKSGSKEDMGSVKSMCMTEALTPFGTTHDDPFRSAMTFVQTAKHGMRVRKSSPALITNGADEALPYLTTDIFAHKAKGAGEVIEATPEYLKVKYNNNTTEFIDLRERVEKNSDGGFYVTLKLDSDLKKGSKVKPNQILAYDKSSYSNEIGNPNSIGYKIGTLAKVAIITTDEGYEDSGIVSPWLSKALSSDVVVKKEVTLPKTTNVLSMVKKGQNIQEGETLILFQNTFDEDDMNALLKQLSDDEEIVSDIGRIPIKSKNTGIVQDIKVYRTVDTEELSPSLKKICNSYESGVKKLKKAANGSVNDYAVTPNFGSDEKLAPTGKLKDTSDGVKIEFYIKYQDDFSVGDKLVTQSALKAVCKDIFPEGKEPYSSFRPEEPIDLFLSTLSVSSRMVCSIEVSGGINKVLVELARSVKDIMGIKYEPMLHEKKLQ